MAITFGKGVLEKAEERGVTEEEARQAASAGAPTAAHSGRNARVKVFPFRSEWKGRSYEEKKVKVVFVEEGDDMILITVVARYGRFL